MDREANWMDRRANLSPQWPTSGGRRGKKVRRNVRSSPKRAPFLARGARGLGDLGLDASPSVRQSRGPRRPEREGGTTAPRQARSPGGDSHWLARGERLAGMAALGLRPRGRPPASLAPWRDPEGRFPDTEGPIPREGKPKPLPWAQGPLGERVGPLRRRGVGTGCRVPANRCQSKTIAARLPEPAKPRRRASFRRQTHGRMGEW